MSDFLRSGPKAASPGAAPPPAAPPLRPAATAPPGGSRNSTVTLLAGIGVLLLAMGVGVLIGRAGNSSSRASNAPTVVTVAGAAGGGASASEEPFTDDWPSGTTGYTVQLQTLPQSGTTVAAVGQAKSAAEGKGASAVGALKSEDFSSLQAGDYIVYSGVFHKQAEAKKALTGLKGKFPGAKVIKVSEGGSGSSSTSTGGGSSKIPTGSGSSIDKPAPPSVLEGESKKGKSYEEKSKNLPDVVSTG